MKLFTFIKECMGKYTWVLLFLTLLMAGTSMLFYKLGHYNGYQSSKINSKQFKHLVYRLSMNDTVKAVDTEIKLSAQDERISGINTRFDDFYILGGIILTLLGIIIASVYVKSDHEIKKHLVENFDTHKEAIEKLLRDSEQIVIKIQSEYDVAQASNLPATNGREGSNEIGNEVTG